MKWKKLNSGYTKNEENQEANDALKSEDWNQIQMTVGSFSILRRNKVPKPVQEWNDSNQNHK